MDPRRELDLTLAADFTKFKYVGLPDGSWLHRIYFPFFGKKRWTPFMVKINMWSNKNETKK